MKEIFSKFFRPSKMDIFLRCNLWQTLKQEEPTPEQMEIMEAGTREHTRLEREEFQPHEIKCKAAFFNTKKICDTLYKEKTLESPEGLFPFKLSGTPDVYGFSNNNLHVLDYKTGSRFVTAKGNIQLLSYSLLIALNHSDRKIDRCFFSILNTKEDCVSTWDTDGESILLLKEKIQKTIKKYMDGEIFSDLDASGDRNFCQFCPSKHFCPIKNPVPYMDDRDRSIDRLILLSKKMKKEMEMREEKIKNGEVISDDLTQYVTHRITKQWKKNIELPKIFYQTVEKFYTPKQAEKQCPQHDIAQYVEEIVTPILKVT